MLAANAQPVAYIRRSIARKGDPGDTSREFQIEAIHTLANGNQPSILDADWGRSAATDKTDKRLAFVGLMDSIEAGQVSILYAYSADRLARSIEWSARLWNACARAGTRIVTTEREFDTSSDSDWTLFSFLAMSNESALRGMTAKASRTAIVRKGRGDQMGRAPYGYVHRMVDGHSVLVPREGEDPAHVVTVFQQAGSYLEAARALNGEGFPTRFGKSWDASTVRHVVKREAPELVPVHTRRGARTLPTALFAGLLRCPHADTHPATPILTPSSAGPGRRMYYCRKAHQDPRHPRPYSVSERKLRPWAEAQVAELGKHLEVTYEGVQADAEAKADALADRRMKWLEQYAEGYIDKAERNRRLAAVDAEMPAVESARRVSTFTLRGQVDWNDPAKANRELRNLWQAIILGPDMLPIRAEWTSGLSPKEQEARQEAQEQEVERAVFVPGEGATRAERVRKGKWITPD